MSTKDYQAKKFEGNSEEIVLDSLTVEEALQININGKPFTITMRTPGNDKALIRGLLHSEDILTNKTYKPDVVIEEENKEGVLSVVNLHVPDSELGRGYSNSRNLLSASSCGICGKTELDDLSFMGKVLSDDKTIPFSRIESFFTQMRQSQNAFDQSGGSHASAAFDNSGKLLTCMEDIGRHNAVDKVVGDLILNDQLSEAFCITVSGRISYEIIVKTFRAKIPVLCAVSAPSSLAVDFAKELGVTLLAFCRDDRATCYAHPERIKNLEQQNIAG